MILRVLFSPDFLLLKSGQVFYVVAYLPGNESILTHKKRGTEKKQKQLSTLSIQCRAVGRVFFHIPKNSFAEGKFVC